MIRLIPLATAVILSAMWCSNASADPDLSLVQVVVSAESSKVTVIGGTRVKVVNAVLQSLKEAQLPCTTVTVGPYLHPTDRQQHGSKGKRLTVVINDRWEGGESRAWIAIPPGVPFEFVSVVSEGLSESGYDDVRLMSEQAMQELLAKD